MYNTAFAHAYLNQRNIHVDESISSYSNIMALEKQCVQNWSAQLAAKEEELKRRESDLYFREQWMQK